MSHMRKYKEAKQIVESRRTSNAKSTPTNIGYCIVSNFKAFKSDGVKRPIRSSNWCFHETQKVLHSIDAGDKILKLFR